MDGSLQLMPVGSSGSFSFGRNGVWRTRPSPTIGANAVLIFEVELLSIQAKDK